MEECGQLPAADAQSAEVLEPRDGAYNRPATPVHAEPAAVRGTFTIDRTAPAVALATPRPQSVSDAESGFVELLIADTNSAGIDPTSISADAVTISGVSVDRVENLSNGLFRLHYADDGQRLSNGVIEVFAVAGVIRDLAGNTASSALAGSFTDNIPVPGPAVTNVTINAGAISRSELDRIDLTFDRSQLDWALQTQALKRERIDGHQQRRDNR